MEGLVARWARVLTKLQPGREERVWKLLILKGRILGYTPPRVFLHKSSYLLDGKGVRVFEMAKEFVFA